MNVQESHLYTAINELLRKELPIILSSIKQTLLKRNNPIINQIKVHCTLETHHWGQNTQWRIEAGFDEFENGYQETTFRPHCIGGFVMLEEVIAKQLLYCNYGQFYNTFVNDKIDEAKFFDEQIAFAELDNTRLTSERLNRVNLFLASFENKFINAIDEINFELLGK